MKPKICSNCGQEKAISEFAKDSSQPNGYDYRCKECGRNRAIRTRETRLQLHTHEWYTQVDRTTEKKCSKCREVKSVTKFYPDRYSADGFRNVCRHCMLHSPEYIYDCLCRNAKSTGLPIHIRKQDFISWYKKKKKVCCHCGLPQSALQFIDYIPKQHRHRLDIERIDNVYGYELDNIDLACHRCQDIHKRPLSFSTSRKICQKFIAPMWRAIWQRQNDMLGFTEDQMSQSGPLTFVIRDRNETDDIVDRMLGKRVPIRDMPKAEEEKEKEK